MEYVVIAWSMLMASFSKAIPVALHAGMAEMLLGLYQCWFAWWVARNAGLTMESPVKILHLV